MNCKVDIEEMTKGLATAVNVHLTDLEACTLFGHVDKDCSGEVSIDELIEAFRRPRRNKKLPKLARPRNASSSFGKATVRAQQERARLAREKRYLSEGKRVMEELDHTSATVRKAQERARKVAAQERRRAQVERLKEQIRERRLRAGLGDANAASVMSPGWMVARKVAKAVRGVMRRDHLNLTAVFNSMDKSHDSKLDWRELRDGVSTAVGIDLSDREASALVARFDRDNDGTVDLGELLRAFRTLNTEHALERQQAMESAKAQARDARKRGGEKKRERLKQGVMTRRHAAPPPLPRRHVREEKERRDWEEEVEDPLSTSWRDVKRAAANFGQ